MAEWKIKEHPFTQTQELRVVPFKYSQKIMLIKGLQTKDRDEDQSFLTGYKASMENDHQSNDKLNVS